MHPTHDRALFEGSRRSPEEILRNLTRPFGRECVRFKKGAGEWYPYFETDDLQDRLNEATGNNWDLEIGGWEWRDRVYVVYGHLEIPGLGRRAGVGIQEHMSKNGNDMGYDMLKGAPADLLKNCLGRFDCGNQVRRMAPLKADPDNPRNRAVIDRYLDQYFPSSSVYSSPAPTPDAAPPVERPASTTRTSRPETVDLKCQGDGCTAILAHQAQRTYSMHKHGKVLCVPCCDKIERAGR